MQTRKPLISLLRASMASERAVPTEATPSMLSLKRTALSRSFFFIIWTVFTIWTVFAALSCGETRSPMAVPSKIPHRPSSSLVQDSPSIEGQVVPDEYVVVFRPQTDPAAATTQLAEEHAFTPLSLYKRSLQGFAAVLSPETVELLAHDPRVWFIEQNRVVTVSTTQSDPTWGLDRIDQHDLPLDDVYEYYQSGLNVHAYVIDTGIRFSHWDFFPLGRAVSGHDAIDGGTADDCHGHGTHVAGTLGGRVYGVAKQVELVAVRVFDCFGAGDIISVMDGVEWVTDNAIKPALANMSLGFRPGSRAVDLSVQNSIGTGITYVVAAGNDSDDACGGSPARVDEALTIAATDSFDFRAPFSNFGTCVDLFAPGVTITSDWYTSDTATAQLSGTSMSAPHVAGWAALILEASPWLLPRDVESLAIGCATEGRIANPGQGSPNKLLYSLCGQLQ